MGDSTSGTLLPTTQPSTTFSVQSLDYLQSSPTHDAAEICVGTLDESPSLILEKSADSLSPRICSQVYIDWGGEAPCHQRSEFRGSLLFNLPDTLPGVQENAGVK